ncbi:MAG: thiamine phosphate synthase [Deltaproteobacteria bacterium]|jgi:thiamine-phosphate pyrophosphorylase|nr:thiamine phosphate synthase [Deltaproteobacteria bacterium]
MPACDRRLVFITDRRLSAGDLAERTGQVLAGGAGRIILREKDLPAEAYLDLAQKIQSLAEKYSAELILHSHPGLVSRTGAQGVHLTQALMLAGCSQNPPAWPDCPFGVSVHSLAEARLAEAAGAGWLLAGPVFPTKCKPGASGNGLQFIEELAEKTACEIWAVGGLRPENLPAVLRAGASAVCLRSPFMEEADPEALAAGCLKAIRQPDRRQPD